MFSIKHKKKTLSCTVLIVVLLFYFPRCKNQAFLQNYRSAIYSYYLNRFHSVPASTPRFHREHHATAIFEAVCFAWELHLHRRFQSQFKTISVLGRKGFQRLVNRAFFNILPVWLSFSFISSTPYSSSSFIYERKTVFHPKCWDRSLNHVLHYIVEQ